MQEIRRFKDILAFSDSTERRFGFHSDTLQIAEISQALWNSMSSYSLKDDFIPETLINDPSKEAKQQLDIWNAETSMSPPKQKTPIVKSLSINVNQICNLKCSYCYASGDGTFGEPTKSISIEKTLPQLQFFIERLPENSSFSIKFIGGEPLLYTEGILAISEYLKQKSKEKNFNVTFFIVTNGTLITDKNLQALIQIKAHVTVSCDGPPEIHDQFRKTKNGSGSSQELLKGIAKLVECKNQLSGLQFSGVFGKHNMHLVEAYKFYSTYPFDFFKFYLEFGELDEIYNKIFQDQFKKVLALAYKRGGESELRRITVVDQYFTQMDEQEKIYHHCGAGVSSLSLDAKNRLYPCPLMIAQPQHEKTMNQELIPSLNQEFKANLIQQNDCNNCWARFICGGGCMYLNELATGELHKKSHSFCERTRFMIVETLSYYAKIRGEHNPSEGESHEPH